MAADSKGRNLQAVGIPIWGDLAFAPEGTTIPTPAQGGSPSFVLPTAFKRAGLITQDGGFEWSMEKDGDDIEFLQEGYRIPSGLAKVEVKVKLAQYDNIVRELAWGKTPDANGFITIDGGGHANRYVVWTEEAFKNNVLRRRVAAVASVASIKVDKTERGTVNATEVTFAVARHESLNNEHLGEWLIDLNGTPPIPDPEG